MQPRGGRGGRSTYSGSEREQVFHEGNIYRTNIFKSRNFPQLNKRSFAIGALQPMRGLPHQSNGTSSERQHYRVNLSAKRYHFRR
ncbi:hypothetical protein USDA257_c47990 [Sinorhizobium fredii USDA 257]|uniref:Uncharacterized protein n=1 Tax=Sinorhizobium fredii (strain USDA 257) TaxID=1185652 RepID=I3XBS8_SINF2|nr:hypothetical protein USDA257_c47990 [Sinorhizobium fredii USDA 257]